MSGEILEFDIQGESSNRFLGQRLLQTLPQNGFNKVTRAWIRNELTKGNDFERAKAQITEEYDKQARYNLKTTIRDNIDSCTRWLVGVGNDDIYVVKKELSDYKVVISKEIREAYREEYDNSDYRLGGSSSLDNWQVERRYSEEHKSHIQQLDNRIKELQNKYEKSLDGYSLKTRIDKVYDKIVISQDVVKSYPDLNDMLVWNCQDFIDIKDKHRFSLGVEDSFEGYYLCAVEIMDNASIVYEDLGVYAHDIIPERVIKSIDNAKALGAKEFQVAYPIFDFKDVSEKEIIRQNDLRRAGTQSQNDNETDKEAMLDPIVIAVSGETLFYVDKWE